MAVCDAMVGVAVEADAHGGSTRLMPMTKELIAAAVTELMKRERICVASRRSSAKRQLVRFPTDQTLEREFGLNFRLRQLRLLGPLILRKWAPPEIGDAHFLGPSCCLRYGTVMTSISGQFLVGLENPIVLVPALSVMGTVTLSSVLQDAVRAKTTLTAVPPLTLM